MRMHMQLVQLGHRNMSLPTELGFNILENW